MGLNFYKTPRIIWAHQLKCTNSFQTVYKLLESFRRDDNGNNKNYPVKIITWSNWDRNKVAKWNLIYSRILRTFYNRNECWDLTNLFNCETIKRNIRRNNIAYAQLNPKQWPMTFSKPVMKPLSKSHVAYLIVGCTCSYHQQDCLPEP